MKKPTISLDEKTAAWIRAHAARQGMSVSRFVGELLKDRMIETRAYNQARLRFLGQKPFRFGFTDGRRPTRGELRDRSDHGGTLQSQ